MQTMERNQHRSAAAASRPTIHTAMRGRPHAEAAGASELRPKLKIKGLNFYYGGFHALKNITMDIPERKVTAFIGPSGCGKSTLLRTFNRMYSLYPDQRAEGEILDGRREPGRPPSSDVSLIRAKIGMVFQKPTPFPMSIYDNIAFGVRLFENLSKRDMDERVEWALGARRDLGRGQGQACAERPEPLGRPAAAAVHRALHRRSSPKCCCWTSPARRSTRSPPPRSRS